MTKNIITSKALDRFPGDNLRVMTRPAIDSTGNVWPKGTKFVAASFGCIDSRDAQRVWIGMDKEHVFFRDEQR